MNGASNVLHLFCRMMWTVALYAWTWTSGSVLVWQLADPCIHETVSVPPSRVPAGASGFVPPGPSPVPPAGASTALPPGGGAVPVHAARHATSTLARSMAVH